MSPDPTTTTTSSSGAPEPWTRDGYWIGDGPEPAPGTPGYPRLRAKCGGPGLCPNCAADRDAYRQATVPGTASAPAEPEATAEAWTCGSGAPRGPHWVQLYGAESRRCTGHNDPAAWVTTGQAVRLRDAYPCANDTVGHGRVFAYTEHPTVSVVTADGRRIDWAAHLCEPIPALPDRDAPVDDLLAACPLAHPNAPEEKHPLFHASQAAWRAWRERRGTDSGGDLWLAITRAALTSVVTRAKTSDDWWPSDQIRLRGLAHDYGPLGVALAAARLADPAVLVDALQTDLLAPDPAPTVPAPENPAPGRPDPEQVARRFHETYERLAPEYGYRTREASAVPWPEVPENNRRLMIAVATELLDVFAAPPAVEVSVHNTDTSLFERGNVEIIGQIDGRTHLLASIDPRDVTPQFAGEVMRFIGEVMDTEQARMVAETAAARYVADAATQPGPDGYQWATAPTPAGLVWHLVRADWPLPAPARCGRRVTRTADEPGAAAQRCGDCAPADTDAQTRWSAPRCEHDHPLARALVDTVAGLDPWLPGEIAAAVQALAERGSVDGLRRDPAQALTGRLRQAASDTAALAELRNAHTVALARVEAISADRERVRIDLQRHRDAIRSALPVLQHWWNTAAIPLLDAFQRQMADLGLADDPTGEPRMFDDPNAAYDALIVVEPETDNAREDWHRAGCLDCPWTTSGLRDVCEQAGHAHVAAEHLTAAPDIENTHRGQN